MNEQRVALVTGAARGIGAACARQLSADGFAVAALDICAPIEGLTYAASTRAQLDEVVANLPGEGLALVADVRDSAGLDRAVAEVVNTFGGLDVVVTAAGVMGGGGASAWSLTDTSWDLNIDINLTGVWRTIRAAVPAMLERPHPRTGRVITIASAAGMRGNPTIADYTAAKHGVIGLTKSVALELAAHEITANAIAPGSTRTAILQASADVYGLADVDEFKIHHPIGRNLDPEEIARGVGWLASPDSSAVTGIVLPIDGGMTI